MDKSIREIERERQGLQNQEKKLIVEIKKSAKQGQMVLSILPPITILSWLMQPILDVRKDNFWIELKFKILLSYIFVIFLGMLCHVLMQDMVLSSKCLNYCHLK